MTTGLSETQESIREEFARLAAGGDQPGLWETCGRRGWFGLTIDADRGGLGLGELEACLFAEQIGRALATPAALDQMAGAHVLARARSSESGADGELPNVIAGRTRVGICRPPAYGHRTAELRSTGDGEALVGDCGVLPGFAPDAGATAPEPAADVALVVTAGRDAVVRLPLDRTGVRVDAGHPAPFRRGTSVTADCPVSGAEVHRSGDLAADAIRQLRPGRVLRHAAYLIGVAARALDLEADHVRKRRQFDQPIGNYQGIRLPLAADHIRTDGLRLQLQQIAADADRGADVHVAADRLAGVVGEHAFSVVSRAVHAYGARGLSDEAGVGACLRRLRDAGHPDVGQETAPAPTTAPPAAELLRHWQRRRVPAEWNATADDGPYDLPVHELIAQVAESYAHLPAVRFGRDQISYGELHRRADRLARALHGRGVGPDVPVGIHLRRSIDMVVALLGTLKAGGAYLPLDPDYPSERLEFMIEDSGTPLVITEERLAADVPGTVPALVIDGDHEPPYDDGAPLPRVGPRDLAYLIYTSGSTGRPKGVEIEHRGVANRLCWDLRTFGLGPEDAVLQHTSLNFDISVWEIFAPLLAGARLVLARPGAAREPADLMRTVHDEAITALAVVPSLLDVLIEEQPGLADCPRLRYVFSGGEALQPDLCRRVFAAAPQVALYNFYGPSEATVDVTSWHCTPGSIGDGVPIGRPLANVRTYVLDDAHLPVPVGRPGELYVGGMGVARGYRNRPAETAERFPGDPFGEDAGAHLYKTGDLVRYRPDGALEFLGRVDDQVKVRGFRIELGEIERTLEQHRAVRQAVAKSSGSHIDAFVTGHDGHDVSEATLRGHVRGRLPDYMVPARVEHVPSFPRTPSGKVDRGALTAPPRRRDDAGTAAGTSLAAGVLYEMSAILDVDGVGPADDFFELGGTSLQAARLVARLRRELGLDIDLRTFLDRPTSEAVVAAAGPGTHGREEDPS